MLAVEKRLTSTLLEPSSVEKIMEVSGFMDIILYCLMLMLDIWFQVDDHIAAAVSGLIGGAAKLPLTLCEF